jgi:SagB-type dehydrogenase family enzyme
MASFTERYHEYTKYNPYTIDKLGDVDWENQPSTFKPISEQDALSLIPHLEFLKDDLSQLDWEEHFKGHSAAHLNYLAPLLYFTSGISTVFESPGQTQYLRCNPSAGGLYPIENYLIVTKNPEIEPGVYAHHPLQMALIKVAEIEEAQALLKNIHHLKNHEGTYILYTGLFGRNEWRYKQRSYRRILLDFGHAVENTLLFNQFNNKGGVLYPSFNDQLISQLSFFAPDEFPLTLLELNDEAKGEFVFTENISPLKSYKDLIEQKELVDSMMVQQNLVESYYEEKPLIKVENSPTPTDSTFEGLLTNLPDKIRSRRSCRRYIAKQIPLRWVEDCLKASFAQQESRFSNQHLKFALASINVDGLPIGVYTLNSNGEIDRDNPRALEIELLTQASLGQEIATDASFLIFFYSDLNQATADQGDRVYRHLCFDAGRIGERINIACSKTPYGTSGIGGYFDDMCNEVAGLEAQNAILYLTSCGVSQ